MTTHSNSQKKKKKKKKKRKEKKQVNLPNSELCYPDGPRNRIKRKRKKK